MSTNLGRKGKGPTDGSWKPGQSGNPKGRPKKDKALTAVLSKAAQRYFEFVDEDGKVKKQRRDEFIAESVLTALTMGKVTFPAQDSDSPAITITLDNSDWMRLLQFYFQRIEGTPQRKQEKEDEDSTRTVSADEVETIAEQRWDKSLPQVLEMLEEFEEEQEGAEDGEV